MGGLWAGSLRVHRRGRLRREVERTDAVYEATKTTPGACETALEERRAAIRGLLLRGKVDEGQAVVLERHVDELRRALRLAPLHDELDHLPQGLVRRLERILADGHVTKYEHGRVLAELQADGALSRQQKEKLRSVLDAWRARDAGAERAQ